MILPLMVVLSALTPGEGAEPSVRLAPVLCPALSDVDVRGALKVELRGRLLADDARSPEDFVLVSVSCAGEKVSLLAVRQGAGTPARREVPTASLAAEARPRAIAIAIAELLRVDLARNSPLPTEATPLQAPERSVALSGAVAVGGYFSGASRHWYSGNHLRVALESATAPAPGQRWGGGVAFELYDSDNFGDRFDLLPGLSFLLRRRGERVTPELAVGARLGPSWDYLANAPSPVVLIGGPFASAAIDMNWYRRGFVRIAAEGGFDFGVRGGGWTSLLVGGGFRF